MSNKDSMIFDLATADLSEVNQALQNAKGGSFSLRNPEGKHALACGLMQDNHVTIAGHAGYYLGGMNQNAAIVVEGNAGAGCAENMMSGKVTVQGDASQYAGASAHGGLLVIQGNAAARCGISMKGVDIVVGGNVGHMSGFMAQAGRMVVLGDAGADLGDSIYEARIYVRGSVKSLGADCIEKPMHASHKAEVQALLDQAGLQAEASDFKRYGSSRKLYNFNIDNLGEY